MTNLELLHGAAQLEALAHCRCKVRVDLDTTDPHATEARATCGGCGANWVMRVDELREAAERMLHAVRGHRAS